MSSPETGPRMPRGLRTRVLPVIAAALLVPAATVLVYKETRQAERDWHAVRAQVYDIEKALRRHEVDAYVRSAGEGSPLPVETEQRLVRDFERLSHLQDFAMTDVEIRFEGDTAFVRYRVEGAPGLRDDRPPSAGELAFRKRDGFWRLLESRLSP